MLLPLAGISHKKRVKEIILQVRSIESLNEVLLTTLYSVVILRSLYLDILLKYTPHTINLSIIRMLVIKKAVQ